MVKEEGRFYSFRKQAGGDAALFSRRLPWFSGHRHLQQAEKERSWRLSHGRFFMGLALLSTFFWPEISHTVPLATKEAGKCRLCAQGKKRKSVPKSHSRLHFESLFEDK